MKDTVKMVFSYYDIHAERKITAHLVCKNGMYIWIDSENGEKLENLDPANSVSDACYIAETTFSSKYGNKENEWNFDPKW